MKFVKLAACLLLFSAAGANADTLHEEQRKLYALVKAAPDYCPNIEARSFAAASVGYKMNINDQEYDRYLAEREAWLATFKKAGSRATVCEALMQAYGPGGKVELFQFK